MSRCVFAILGKTHSDETKLRIRETTKDKVVVIDLQTNEKIRISKEEFYSNRNRYVGHTKGVKPTDATREKNRQKQIGKVVVFDKELGKRVKILKSDYELNVDRYWFCVSVVDLNTGEKKTIPTFEFYANKKQYVTTKQYNRMKQAQANK